ncbi:ATP-binding protein [Paenibacillus filicis]|uniref:histidine kinase n=1 Tax=Paenibacillus gyeongsangnamensis TaxID=3388067 RepID=A0ABT4Q6I8_9BACL|nr:HAMP domain-containing sensor histidine kinase [Paenibacillus filicis]MCZ8512446.1 ATP-binding protein [Paenibacillus filicis]
MKLNFRSWIGRLIAPNSLRFQLLARSLLILLALLVLIGAFQYVLMKEFIYANRVQNIKSQIMTTPPPFWVRWAELQRNGTQRDPSLYFRFPDSAVAFVNSEGKLTELTDDGFRLKSPQLSPETYAEVLQENPQKIDYRIAKDADGVQMLVVLQPINDRNRTQGIVQVSSSIAPLEQLLTQELWIYIILSLLALVIGWAGFSPVLRRTLVPLNRIVGTMERINAGNMNERLPESQKQLEIDRLSASFNGMLERLEVSFEAEKEAKEQMRRFVADASHELRTPLTSIHGFLEVLLRGAASNPEQLEKALRSMHSESERLNKLVKDLLFLARMDQKPGIQLQEGSLDALVREMEAQLQLLAGRREVRFVLTPGTKAWIDKDQMKQVILNLFHNAVQHTDPVMGKIGILVDGGAGGAELIVRDNGHGIPAEHLPHLFERFYRADASRTRKHGGAGLGLSITKSIVDLHEAEIRVESTPGEGTAFMVRFPPVTGKTMALK